MDFKRFYYENNYTKVGRTVQWTPLNSATDLLQLLKVVPASFMCVCVYL